VCKFPSFKTYLAIICVTVQLWIQEFLVISMYFTLRNLHLKYDRFFHIHPIYVPYTVIPHPT